MNENKQCSFLKIPMNTQIQKIYFMNLYVKDCFAKDTNIKPITPIQKRNSEYYFRRKDNGPDTKPEKKVVKKLPKSLNKVRKSRIFL